MKERKRVLVLILIMAFSCLIVAGITILSLYQAAISEERERLVETAQSQARLIEAVARFDAIYSKSYAPGGARAATLSKINESHNNYEQSNRIVEFTLAERKGDSINFLLMHRHGGLEHHLNPVSFDSKLAEPMRQALLGRSGTIVGEDYRGELVLAAHEPVSELDLGIVAKIDLSEIRAPFLKAGLIAGFFSVLVVLGGTTLFVRISNPMIKLLEERNTSLERANTKLKNEIEKRTRVERAVRDSEQKYRQLVEQLQEGVWAIDKDANTTYVNPRMAEILGYTVDEMQEKHLFAFMDERGVEISQRNLERRKQGIKEQHDFEFIHKNGQKIYTGIETSPITDEQGKYIGALACVADITDRKKAEEDLSKLNLELEERVKQRTEQLEAEIVERIQAEETLSKNKEMLQMIFDGISDPLLMLNANLEVRLLNKAASEYYFVDQKSVLGKLCYQAFIGRSAPCEGCQIQSAIQNRYFEMLERKGFMDSNKTEKVFIYHIEDGHDGLDSAIIRISDITQEKMLQRQIVQTEKLSSLGFLVSGVAHEINNPNNFITFNIPILKEYLNEIIPIIDDYAKKHENLEVCCMPYPEFRNDIFKLVKNIENGARRIQTAVSNLRGITRVKDKLQMDMIDIQEVIGKGVSICRGKINRLVKSFEVDIPKDLPRIFADSETIELVIINLLINAAQAADKDNSWIRLQVSLGDSRQNHLIIKVRDNGCGMDEKTQSHIFEPFFTTKSPNEGTGLGLTLCLNSIEELGGHIEVDSIQGKGSTFRVILPDKENRHTKRL